MLGGIRGNVLVIGPSYLGYGTAVYTPVNNSTRMFIILEGIQFSVSVSPEYLNFKDGVLHSSYTLHLYKMTS